MTALRAWPLTRSLSDARRERLSTDIEWFWIAPQLAIALIQRLAADERLRLAWHEARDFAGANPHGYALAFKAYADHTLKRLNARRRSGALAPTADPLMKILGAWLGLDQLQAALVGAAIQARRLLVPAVPPARRGYLELLQAAFPQAMTSIAFVENPEEFWQWYLKGVANTHFPTPQTYREAEQELLGRFLDCYRASIKRPWTENAFAQIREAIATLSVPLTNAEQHYLHLMFNIGSSVVTTWISRDAWLQLANEQGILTSLLTKLQRSPDAPALMALLCQPL